MQRTFIGFCAMVAMSLGAPLLAGGDPYQPKQLVQIHTAPWARAATIYEINTRQFTPEGTFRAAEKQLPRIKALGVDIVWLMPVQPIGVKNRKGTLGSPYAVRDYRGVNPEFGTVADLKAFVVTAHKLGLHVILDWVGNHTAWDNVLMKSHPEYYDKDWKGDFHPTPWQDWGDIIDLDYSKPGLRKYLIESMAYWVHDVGVDGFRCDVGGYVPLDFWEAARAQLDKIKPVFMMAEWDARDLHYRAFDATYAWPLYGKLSDIALGKATAQNLYGYYADTERSFPKEAMRMTFVENHDKNAWEGTQYEAFGDALPAAIALTVVGSGIPMIHNGQEAGNHKRLAFFEKDTIVWKDDPIAGLYTRLFALKHSNPALWNGAYGAKMIKVENDKPDAIFSFVRQQGGNKVLAVFNFSKSPVTATFPSALINGQYSDFDGGAAVHFASGDKMTLPAWGYKIYTHK